MSKLQPPSKVVKVLDDGGRFGVWWFNWLLQLFNVVNGHDSSLSAGVSVTITTAKLTPSGHNGSMTFTNGILTSHTDAT